MNTGHRLTRYTWRYFVYLDRHSQTNSIKCNKYTQAIVGSEEFLKGADPDMWSVTELKGITKTLCPFKGQRKRRKTLCPFKGGKETRTFTFSSLNLQKLGSN